MTNEQQGLFDPDPEWLRLQSDVIEAHELGDRRRITTAEEALQRFNQERVGMVTPVEQGQD